MRERHYTQEQFNNILDILIRYKRSCPDREVSLSESSLQEALLYVMMTFLFYIDLRDLAEYESWFRERK